MAVSCDVSVTCDVCVEDESSGASATAAGTEAGAEAESTSVMLVSAGMGSDWCIERLNEGCAHIRSLFCKTRMHTNDNTTRMHINDTHTHPTRNNAYAPIAAFFATLMHTNDTHAHPTHACIIDDV